MRAGEYGHQIDRDQPGPVFRCRVREESMLIDAGIVDDDIERTMARHYALHHHCIGDVELDRDRADLFGKSAGACDVEIGDHNTGARGCKLACDRRTDALGSTGDEGTPSVKPPERQRARHRSASREMRLAPLDYGRKTL